MKKYQGSIEEIEHYLQGMLNEEGQVKFEESIANDKDLAEKVETYKLLIDGIKYSSRKDLKEKLDTWDQDLPSHLEGHETVTNRRRISWYYIAATISFFVIASALVYMNIDTGFQGVVAKHYKVYEHPSTGVRGDADAKKSLNAVVKYYDLGQYEKTIEIANQLELGQRTTEIDFILANAYMAINSIEEASVLFEEISTSDGMYKNASKWYLALCYLSNENPDQALLLLNELKNSTSSYSDNAVKLLRDLN